MTSAAQSEFPVSFVGEWERAAAEAVLPHVPLAETTGTVLVAGAGDASFATDVLERVGKARRILFADAAAERLDRVRNLDAARVPAFFNHQSSRELGFDDDVFEVALCVRDITTTADALNMMASLARVVHEGGYVAVVGVGPRSLDTLSEVLAESVYAADSSALSEALADHLARRVATVDLEDAAKRLSLDTVASGTQLVAVTVADSSQAMQDPCVIDIANGWRGVDDGIRAVGTSIADTLDRMQTYFADQPLTEQLELSWIVARVSVAESIAIDDADVVAEL